MNCILSGLWQVGRYVILYTDGILLKVFILEEKLELCIKLLQRRDFRVPVKAAFSVPLIAGSFKQTCPFASQPSALSARTSRRMQKIPEDKTKCQEHLPPKAAAVQLKTKHNRRREHLVSPGGTTGAPQPPHLAPSLLPSLALTESEQELWNCPEDEDDTLFFCFSHQAGNDTRLLIFEMCPASVLT